MANSRATHSKQFQTRIVLILTLKVILHQNDVLQQTVQKQIILLQNVFIFNFVLLLLGC